MIPESRRMHRGKSVSSRKIKQVSCIGSLGVIFLVGMLAGGTLVHHHLHPARMGRLQNTVETLQQQIDHAEFSRDQMFTEKALADNNIDWLTREVGKLQAHVVRIEALGIRLSELANLDGNEFNFGGEAALGGPLAIGPEEDAVLGAVRLANAPSVELPHQDTEPAAPESYLALAALNDQVEFYSSQLRFIESYLIQNQVNGDSTLSGWPIRSGWLSSRFGTRVDPFTGKRAFHNGIDLSGRRGAEIMAVADGIVTWSGNLNAYGLLVELDHGKGYHTRYAHAHKLLVQHGERVKKGQVIALMGTTGRSTGNHLHFEVRRDGKAEDPLRHVRRDS